MPRLFPAFILAALASLTFAGCADMNLSDPFTPEKPFTPTAVPADFAIIVDKETSNYYSREHIRHVITQEDMMSRASYRTYRDYNNTLSNAFDHNVPLLPEQIQSLWNQVEKNNLLVGGTLWLNAYSDADKYRLNQNQIQIRANGHVKTYTAANGYPTNMRELVRLLDAVRLYTTDSTPVVGASQPATEPATSSAPSTQAIEKALTPATMPATMPTTVPMSTPATLPTTEPAK